MIPAARPGAAALVTGASSGVGVELARQLAARGHDLIIVARREDRLSALATELQEQHGVRVSPIACDISDPVDRAKLQRAAESLEIDVLALSAGFGMSGPLTAHDPEQLQLMIRTNVEGNFMLVRAFAPAMESRRSGAILIVGSMAGNQPMPNFGAYAATKAALTPFAEMLHEELRRSGVTVSIVLPGEILTEFAAVADVERATRRVPSALKITPEECAQSGLDALDAGRRTAMPRAGVRAFAFLGSHAPRGLWLRAARRLMA